MKKWACSLLALVPPLAGWAWMRLMMWSGGAQLLNVGQYIVGIGLLAFWFWAGRRFAAAGFAPVPAVLLGNALGIASLAVHVWWYMAGPDTIAPWLQAASVHFAFLTIPFVGWLARLLAPPEVNALHTLQVGQILGVLLMLTVFTAGYLACRGRRKKQDSRPG